MNRVCQDEGSAPNPRHECEVAMKRAGTLEAVMLLIGFLSSFPCRPLFAQGEIEAPDRQRIRSGILKEERSVTVYLPGSYAAGGGPYPLLVVLDGEDFARPFAGVISYYAKIGKCPELIVAGIDAGDRWRDYTPTNAAIPDGTPLPTSGHADSFMKFLDSECLPMLQAKYRVSPFRVLFGHSIAGLLSVSQALEGGSAFSAFMATSPSLWWDRELLAARAKIRPEPDPSRPRCLFLTMGGEGPTMLDPLLRFTACLEENPRPGLNWELRRFEGVDHQAMPVKAFAYGLEYVFHDWPLPQELVGQGLAAVVEHYELLSRRYMQKISPPESTVNRLGYNALNRGAIAEALEIFRLNVELYPLSANVHDSMGEACLKAGDGKCALSHYRKALELDPGNERIRDILNKLEAKE